MSLQRVISGHQSQLVADVHSLWSALSIPDWTAPDSEPNGWEPEHVEISRYLTGKSYDAARNFCCSESVFIWCRPDVATYYLGGYLLNAMELLEVPDNYATDFHILNLHSFLTVQSLYDEVYLHILGTIPTVIPLMGRYAELLRLYQNAGPSQAWIFERTWPESPETIETICNSWHDREVFQKAVEALPPIG
jgi:hypothetical protein